MRIRNMLADFQGRFMEWETGTKPDFGVLNGPPNEHHMELQMNDFNALLALVTALISILALVFSLYSFTLSRHKKRRKLIDAIYYHVTEAEGALATERENNDKIRKTIKTEEAYTPYFVVVSPAANDLTYQQVIEAMEWLNREEGRVLLGYFYKQSDVHALAQSFNSEHVRIWSQERKLAMWDDLDRDMKETIAHARKMKTIMVKKWNMK